MELRAINKALFGRLKLCTLCPVFDSVPENSKMPYTVLGETRLTPWGSKTTAGFEAVLGILIYSGYKGDREINDIAAAVSGLLTYNPLTLGEELTVIKQTLEEVKIERLLDAWLDEQTRKLEDTKAANANYERDKQYLAETYAEKRRKLLLDEKKDLLDIKRSISDMVGKFRDQTVSFDLKGSGRQKFDFAKDARDQIQEMERGVADLSIKWEGMAAKEKNTMREALETNGVLFKESEEGKISFAEESARRRAEIERQAAEETAEYIQSGRSFIVILPLLPIAGRDKMNYNKTLHP